MRRVVKLKETSSRDVMLCDHHSNVFSLSTGSIPKNQNINRSL